jgi:N-acetylglutamate synthase-like GNAT family acetyltransferase
VASYSDGAIRVARITDADAVAGLLGDLGYGAEAAEVAGRLKRLLNRADGGVLVYQRDGVVVGVAAFQIIELLERADPQCRLTALAVSSPERRRGVARTLLEALESQARDRGCFRLEVTTHPQRDDAPAFYEALGFEERPRRLVKPLDQR